MPQFVAAEVRAELGEAFRVPAPAARSKLQSSLELQNILHPNEFRKASCFELKDLSCPTRLNSNNPTSSSTIFLTTVSSHRSQCLPMQRQAVLIVLKVLKGGKMV